MASVSVRLSDAELKREERGVTFIVRSAKGEDLLGKLKVSKGGLRWWSKDQKGGPHFASWEEMGRAMTTFKREY